MQRFTLIGQVKQSVELHAEHVLGLLLYPGLQMMQFEALPVQFLQLALQGRQLPEEMKYPSLQVKQKVRLEHVMQLPGQLKQEPLLQRVYVRTMVSSEPVTSIELLVLIDNDQRGSLASRKVWARAYCVPRL